MRESARPKERCANHLPAGASPPEADVRSTLRFIKFARGGFPARGVVMGKISFVFSGQGAQFAGMGKVFYENCERARNLFNKAEEVRPGTIGQCFEGSADELKMTENTQPCLYLASLAASYAMDEAGISADMTAGFSLGEISSLAYAGAYTAEEGFRIVCRRAELMAQAAAENPAYMAAVVKLGAEKIEELASKFSRTYPVNYNSAEQTVISGDPAERDAFAAEVKAAGGRLIPLAVSGGFHSPFMAQAAARFGEFLRSADIKAPSIPAYSNFTAGLYGDDVRTLLENQINHPVRWQKTVLDMARNGADTFIELGAGSTLAKLISKTLPDAKVFSVSGYEDIENIKEAL